MKRRTTMLTVVLALATSHAWAHPGAHRAHSPEVSAKLNQLRTTEAVLASHIAREGESPALLAKLADVRLRLARQSGAHTDYRVAHSAYDRLVASSPDSALAFLGRGYARLGLHEFDAALSDARRARLLDEDAPETLALLADVHLALGNYPEASLASDRLLEDAITLESLTRVGLIAFERSRYADAEAMFTDAMEAGRLLVARPGSIAWASTMLGDARGARGDRAGAERAYREAIAIDPDAHHASAKLAHLLADEGEIEEAESIMVGVVDRYPLADHRLTLASICLMHGESHDVQYAGELERGVHAEMTAMLEDNDLAHTRHLVEFWLRRSLHTDRAVELALAELSESRRDVGAYETASWALHASGRHEEAAQHARAALRIAPNSPRLLLRAGIVLLASGDHASSERALRAGLESGAVLDADLIKEAREALGKIEESRQSR